MCRVYLLVVTTIMIVIGSTSVAAQKKPESLVGKVIRITTDSTDAKSTTTGVLRRLDSTSAYLQRWSDSREVQIPVLEIDRLQVHGRGHSNVLLGALIGCAAGAAIMTVITELDSDSHDFIDLSGVFILFGAGSGLVAGGIAGSRIRSGEWQTVPKDRLYIAGLSPQGRGVKLVVGLRF